MMNIIFQDGTRTTVSYARYLMSISLGRILDKEEHVDHIDEDKANDNIDNLQLLSLKDNIVKHMTLKDKFSNDVELVCPVCGITFYRPPRNVNHKISKGKVITCSRKCGGVISHK